MIEFVSRRRVVTALTTAALVLSGVMLAPAPVARACVGMTVTIGFKDGPEFEMAARILSSLIVERTGTSTEIVPVATLEELHGRLASGKVGIALLPLGYAIDQLTTAGLEDTADDPRAFVRTRYNLDQDLIWLDALGFDAPSGGGWLSDGPESPVSPVIRKDVIEDFPAMPRLIRKLADRLPREALDASITEMAAGEKPKRVVRRFLEAERLI